MQPLHKVYGFTTPVSRGDMTEKEWKESLKGALGVKVNEEPTYKTQVGEWVVVMRHDLDDYIDLEERIQYNWNCPDCGKTTVGTVTSLDDDEKCFCKNGHSWDPIEVSQK